eukprot:1023564-Rhodomonas_salina.2
MPRERVRQQPAANSVPNTAWQRLKRQCLSQGRTRHRNDAGESEAEYQLDDAAVEHLAFLQGPGRHHHP